MSGNRPSIVLVTSTSPTLSTNVPTIQATSVHGNTRPPIIVHQSNIPPPNISSLPIRSLIVKPQHEPNQQAHITKPPHNFEIKPIIVQTRDALDNQQPNKRIALDSTNLNNSSLSFTTVSTSEVLNSFKSNQTSNNVPFTNISSQSTTSIPPFSAIRLIDPSNYVQNQNVHHVMTSAQHGNVVLQQPIISLQVPHEPSTAQKENPSQLINLATDSSVTDPKISTSDYLPIQYQRKPCNCTKSMCLKLYCDCFANGLYCQNCSCLNCHNDSRHEDDRHKAINATLERNPNAFKSKMYKFGQYSTNQSTIPTDRPLKGCNCKKSSCHKRYCECYEARVPCTSLCKCVGCKNTEQAVHPMNVGFYRSGQPKNTTLTPLDQIPRIGPPVESTGPNNVFNVEVTEALASCLLIVGQQCEINQMNDHDSQEAILKEFQRCMHHIFQSALGRTTTS